MLIKFIITLPYVFESFWRFYKDNNSNFGRSHHKFKFVEIDFTVSILINFLNGFFTQNLRVIVIFETMIFAL